MRADLALLYNELHEHEASIVRLDHQAATTSFNRSYHEAEAKSLTRQIEALLREVDL